MSLRHSHMGPTNRTLIAVTRQSHFVRVLAQLGLVLTLFGCQSPAQQAPDDSVPNPRQLVDLRSRILAYTADFRSDGPYASPTDTQREQLAEGVGHLLEGETKEAQRLLAAVGFGVNRLTDSASGRRYDEVAATRPGKGEHWGRLYLNANSGILWNAQVPHPVADQDTEQLGVRLLEGAPGGALVLAGAHRRAGEEGAADVAHREDSLFHAIVLELQKRGVPGVQLHGFARSSERPYEAVLSTGAARNALNETSALADRLETDGLRVCRGWSARCPLEGATNVQGRAAEDQGAKFVHVELAPAARGDGSDADTTAQALTGLVTTWGNG